MEIKYFNLENRKMETEKVYGEKAVNWLYESIFGKMLSPLVTHPFFSQMYGFAQDSNWSKGKVAPFIEKFNINMDEFLPEEGRNTNDPYSSFNQFFIRRFKEGKRNFCIGEGDFPAFSEARYFGYENVASNQNIPVKGKFLNAELLLAKDKWIKTFNDGPLLLARLCPVDYHRFHYPDNGKVLDYYPVSGKLHSVNPLALKKKEDIFSTNFREVTILETENFGKLAYVEVGATCVGKIAQTSNLETFKRGDEKGYFLFGGSTVIVLGEKGKWKPNNDVLENSSKGIEVYSHLGRSLANKLD